MGSESIHYSIRESIFTQFPAYVRGVVVAEGVSNGESPPELVNLLREAEELLRDQLNADTLVDDPRISSWREAYRAFGAKPAKFRPSLEAMARRVLRGEVLPSVNRLVDIGNVISLRWITPAGGHATDVMREDIELRHAEGSEEFIPFGSEEQEHPEPGEIVFVEGSTVLTRRWTWRQAEHTLLTPSTTEMELNVDGLPPISVSDVEEACQQSSLLIERFCGGATRHELLSATHPAMQLR